MRRILLSALALIVLSGCAVYPSGYVSYRDGHYRDGYYRDGYYRDHYRGGYYRDHYRGGASLSIQTR